MGALHSPISRQDEEEKEKGRLAFELAQIRRENERMKQSVDEQIDILRDEQMVHAFRQEVVDMLSHTDLPKPEPDSSESYLSFNVHALRTSRVDHQMTVSAPTASQWVLSSSISKPIENSGSIPVVEPTAVPLQAKWVRVRIRSGTVS